MAVDFPDDEIGKKRAGRSYDDVDDVDDDDGRGRVEGANVGTFPLPGDGTSRDDGLLSL